MLNQHLWTLYLFFKLLIMFCSSLLYMYYVAPVGSAADSVEQGGRFF